MKARAEAPGSDAAQDPHAVRAKVLNLLVVFTDGLSAASKSEFSRTVTDTSSRLGMPNFNFRIITARNASAGAPAAAGHRSEGLIRAEAADGAIAAEPPAFAEGSSLDEHDHANLRAAKAYGRAAPGGGKFQLSWSNGRDVAGTHARVLPCIPEHHRLSRMSDPAAQRRACAHAVLPDPVATAMCGRDARRAGVDVTLDARRPVVNGTLYAWTRRTLRVEGTSKWHRSDIDKFITLLAPRVSLAVVQLKCGRVGSLSATLGTMCTQHVVRACARTSQRDSHDSYTLLILTVAGFEVEGVRYMLLQPMLLTHTSRVELAMAVPSHTLALSDLTAKQRKIAAGDLQSRLGNDLDSGGSARQGKFERLHRSASVTT
eukprot:352836-Chlamydomonas_euryale.AAC.13